jgi:hypothetical protein
MMLTKIILGFLLIATVETLNGIFRVRYLRKKLGAKRANTLSFVLGSFSVVLINIFLYPAIAPQSFLQALTVGISWALLMICYDLYVGRVLFKLSWDKVLNDFNLFKGNLLSLGMILILILPPLFFLLLER